MATAHEGTPGYFEDGWYNGNPHKWIEHGSYPKFRDRLPGLKYSDSDIADLDAAWEAAEKIRKQKKLKPADGTDAAAAAKLAEHQKKVDADIAAAEEAGNKPAKKKASKSKAKGKKKAEDEKVPTE